MRGRRAVTKIVASAGLIAFVATMAWSHRLRRPVRLVLWRQMRVLPADGEYHRAVDLRRSDSQLLFGEDLGVSGLRSRLVPGQDGGVTIEVQAPSLAGERRVSLRSPGAKAAAVTITFVPDTSDRFGDGTPEFMRLHTDADRRAFRAWFTELADAIATLPAMQLPSEVDDCAALLRWCYRNALHAHDEAWQAGAPFSAPPPLPSVEQYVWPETPLGANLFRVKDGAYAASDTANGTFAQFADAHTLLQHNTFFVSRDFRAALPGDLLFYRQLEQDSPFHSMILTGGSAQWAVYHTGPIGRGLTRRPGQIRRVLVNDLVHHPDRQWRPKIDNENFLGVYRWNILRQDSQ